MAYAGETGGKKVIKYRTTGCIRTEFDPTKQKNNDGPISNEYFTYQEHYGGGPLKEEVDLRHDMTAVENQAGTSSCVANAIAGAYEYLLKYEQKHDDVDISRLFVYYNAREKDRNLQLARRQEMGDNRPVQNDRITDNGCTVPSAIYALTEYRVCLEDIWKFDERQVNDRPHKKAYDVAKQQNLQWKAYKIHLNLEDMKACLSKGYPFVFCTKTFNISQKRKDDAELQMPTEEERMIARRELEENKPVHRNHAMLAVGYNQTHFIVRNSYGTSWGEHGYCYMPFDYLTDSELTWDAWMICFTNEQNIEGSNKEDEVKDCFEEKYGEKKEFPEEPEDSDEYIFVEDEECEEQDAFDAGFDSDFMRDFERQIEHHQQLFAEFQRQSGFDSHWTAELDFHRNLLSNHQQAFQSNFPCGDDEDQPNFDQDTSETTFNETYEERNDW